MAWSPKINHLEKLEDIINTLMQTLQPDTILTDLPYDLEFLNKSEIENYVEWCKKSIDKEDLEANEGQGAFSINEPLTKFYVEKNYPKLDKEKQKEKIKYFLEEMRTLLGISEYDSIKLNLKNVDTLKEKISETPGESSYDKMKKRIKIAIALRWLHDKKLAQKLSKDTNSYIRRIGDFYGKCKKGENVDIQQIGTYRPPKEDIEKLQEDYEKVDIALIEATKEIAEAKKSLEAQAEENERDIYGHFKVIVNAVNRINLFVKGNKVEGYDYIERFKDSMFMAIILNYVQDPHVRQTSEIVNLLKWIVPIYQAYRKKEEEGINGLV
ncbi:MAG: hypothetical protein ACPLXC_01980 [Candidatus Pacearchaeota archaeon]